MFDWIAAFVGQWSRTVSADVRDLVHWTVHALASVTYTLASHVAGSWNGLWLSVNWMWRQTTGFVDEVYNWLKAVVTLYVPALWSLMLANAKGLLAELSRLYNAAIGFTQQIWAQTLVSLSNLTDWIVRSVWDPLKSYADDIWNHLLEWGYQAWQLLNDPAKLAAILLTWLIGAAEDAFWTIAGPVGRFAMGVVLHNAARFVKLIETIITAVL